MSRGVKVELASPCAASWEAMQGDANRRFCASCQRNVYDLTGLTRAEIDALVLTHEGRLCVRFFQRADGTALTADCPVGLRERARHLGWRVRAAWGAALASALALLGMRFASEPAPELPTLPPIALPASFGPPAPPELPYTPRRSDRVTTVGAVLSGEHSKDRALRRSRPAFIGIIKGVVEK